VRLNAIFCEKFILKVKKIRIFLAYIKKKYYFCRHFLIERFAREKSLALVAKDREYLSLITKSGAKVLQKNEKYK